MKQDLIKSFNITKEKMVVINNPIDIVKVERLSFEKMRKDFDVNNINILAVGALRKEKRFDLLLETFARLDKNRYRLTIVGDGEMYSSLRELSLELGIEDEVSFTGQQANPYNYMKNADILVLTSAYEGFPNVLLEANSCGTPVLAFNAPGGVSEIVKEGLNGYLVSYLDVNAMASTILSFDAKRFDEEKIKSNVRENYALDVIIKKYEEVLLRCTK